MEIHELQEINDAVSAIQQANSDKQLYKTVVEGAIKLLSSDFGKLYIYDHDKLIKAYGSSPLVTKATLIRNKKSKEVLRLKKTTVLDKSYIHSLKTRNFPSEVETVLFVPLLHHHKTLGYLLTYFTDYKRMLTEEEIAKMTLYSRSVSLAITKAQLQEESKKSLDIRDRFISLASHELRTPLTSIHGYIQLLHARMAKQNKDSVETRWINELYVESLRMTTLVKELLDVNRIKQGQFAFVFSEVPLHDVISRAIDRYRLTDANHPFIFNTTLTKNETMIVGDFDKLVEMVSGILGNAVKFSKPGEKIIVELTNEQGMLSLSVKDKGKGISRKDLHAIFDGFYKGDQASHIEGIGVGLLLARHIVDNHRGKLKIQSKENKGTKVEVILPQLK